jgi:hypothetical protein
MMTFEKKVKEYMEREFRWGSKSWQAYEGAKQYCIENFKPSETEYQVMIKIITDWLDL